MTSIAASEVLGLWNAEGRLDVVHSARFRAIPDKDAQSCPRCSRRTKIFLMDVEINQGAWLLRGVAFEYCLRCDGFAFADKPFDGMLREISSQLDPDS